MPGSPRVEVFTGSHRRRRWSDEQKAAIVAESYETSVGEASARHGLSKAQLFNWRREARGLDVPRRSGWEARDDQDEKPVSRTVGGCPRRLTRARAFRSAD
ncbi:transposase [Phreatobacter sp. AB_2022a]|uniref:transposase n=1 Tax=Phreatobacter sp. AB_2022a TaxID=3003134 RepID=UPI003FA6AA3B